VLGGLRLTQPDQAQAWSEMMERIAALELARTFDFAWAGREDRLFFRFQLTEPVVDSGLGVFRAWADRYYQSAAIPALPEAGGTAGTVVGTGIHHEPGQAPSVVPRGPDGRPLKDGPDGGTDGDTQDGGAAPPADAGGLPHAAGETE
jgi:hypothetical protein